MSDIIPFDPDVLPTNDVGLPNLGNTCYLNSMIQCLLSCTSLYTKMNEMRSEPEIQRNPLFQAMLNLFEKPAKGESIQEDTRIFWKIMMQCARTQRTSILRAGAQEDVHEAFTVFLDFLGKYSPRLKQLFEHRHNIIVECDQCEQIASKRRRIGHSFMFEADLMIEQDEKFMNIDPHYNKPYKLNEFIRKRMSHVDKDYKCPKCIKCPECPEHELPDRCPECPEHDGCSALGSCRCPECPEHPDCPNYPAQLKCEECPKHPTCPNDPNDHNDQEGIHEPHRCQECVKFPRCQGGSLRCPQCPPHLNCRFNRSTYKCPFGRNGPRCAICPKCKGPDCYQKGVKLETTSIAMLPEIIAVLFKKYTNARQKIQKATDYPMELFFNMLNSNKKLKYRLVAKSEHSGGMGGGHYTATALRRNKSSELAWYNLNDSSVSPGDPAPSPNAYMVFYHYVGMV